MLGLGLGLTRVRPASVGVCSGASPALMHFGFAANQYYTRQAGQIGVTSHTFADLLEFTGPAGREYTGSAGETLVAGINQPRIDNFIDTGGGLFNGGLLMISDEGDNLNPHQAVLSGVFGGVMPSALSIAIKGHITYADDGIGVSADGTAGQVIYFSWREDGSNHVTAGMSTGGTAIGQLVPLQRQSGVLSFITGDQDGYSPGINVPFSIASRHGATFINGAHEGTLLTANLTPTALANLIAAPFQIATVGNMTIESMTIWGADIADTGIQDATTEGAGFNPLCPSD